MWMLQEAKRAGMPLDDSKLKNSNLLPPELEPFNLSVNTPFIQVEGQPVQQSRPADQTTQLSSFEEEMNEIATKSRIHDSLKKDGGLPLSAVAAWNFMEWLPFRRMDLQPDGSWRPISLPLPRGEVRDMPDNCIVHHTVLKRMLADPTYRPGNLIVGGGGRGTRVATEEQFKRVDWGITRDNGDIIGEACIKIPAESKETSGKVNGSH